MRGRIAGDLTGSFADLGVLVPLAAAAIATNGLDPAAVFIGAGALVLWSGLSFGIPFPVQPLKALTAVAVAQGLSADVIHAAGIEIAAVLLLLSIGDAASKIAKLFTKPIVRALQVGVGILLVTTAYRLVTQPPSVFRGAPPAPWPFVLAAGALLVVWWAARTRRYALALVLLVAGAAAAWTGAAPVLDAPRLVLPRPALPGPGAFASAAVLLVLPQLPLTFGNAVVAVTDVAHHAFGAAARRVTPSRVCVSCGIGNVFSAVIGGLPMCHGAGGLTAHLRLGARTKWMNVGLGGVFLLGGLAFGDQIPVVLGLLPVWVLAAFLAYAGLRHALLAADLHGADLAIAVGAGLLGGWRGNLALALALAAITVAVRAAIRRRTAATSEVLAG